MEPPRLDPPPIGPTPGDLLLVFRTMVEHLEQLRDSDPDNHAEIDGIALAGKVALDHWIELRDAFLKQKGFQL